MNMDILVVDIGGISVKLHAAGQAARQFPTPPGMTPRHMMERLAPLVEDWRYDQVSVGYPGPVRHNRPLREPVNLGTGWPAFDFAAAFGCPVRIINDAALQALGAYHDGVMLFLGLGTGLGTALVHDGHVVPMELAHLPFRDGETFEHLLGSAGLDALGVDRWKARVYEAIELFSYVLCPESVVLGGGNAQRFTTDKLPVHVRIGDNADAWHGGVRLWAEDARSVGLRPAG